MAEPEVVIDEGAADETMAEAEETMAEETMAEENGSDEPTGLEDIEPEAPERTTFLESVYH
jgi:hypothetical protein